MKPEEKSQSREECSLGNSIASFTIDTMKLKINYNVQIIRQYKIAALTKHAHIYSFVELQMDSSLR